MINKTDNIHIGLEKLAGRDLGYAGRTFVEGVGYVKSHLAPLYRRRANPIAKGDHLEKLKRFFRSPQNTIEEQKTFLSRHGGTLDPLGMTPENLKSWTSLSRKQRQHLSNRNEGFKASDVGKVGHLK